MGIFSVQARGLKASVKDARGRKSKKRWCFLAVGYNQTANASYILQNNVRGEGGEEVNRIHLINLMKSIRAGDVFEACIGTLHQK